jgi:hypothetical protein
MTAYVTPQEYTTLGYDTIPAEDLERYLNDASRNIDTLTFNRIVARGFDRLTDFQQEIVQDVVCRQANFLYENADAIASILDSYSINSVSMKFGSGFNVSVAEGVPVQNTVYSILKQTGLCWRGAV